MTTTNTSTQTLAEYIKERNEKTAADGWTLCDDIESWNKYYDVFTPADLDHYLAASDLFELTREVYGYKMDWSGLKAMSTEEIQKELDKEYELLKAQREQEKIDKEKEQVENYTPEGGSLVSLEEAFKF